MRLCALIIHSNRAVRGRQEFDPTVQNVLQVTKQTTGYSLLKATEHHNVLFQSIETPSPTSQILRTIKLFLHISKRNIPHIKSCQILSLEKITLFLAL